ncbi:hypothetical protein Slin15195_G092010 [Septoria linicola]|uniref:RWD domain-containing protein n=1 Tax=Septoria linicola TaxID=215465 RepID=A0A9Q9AU57_9PEZI|nr:hypothetical protein Slin15195_G092010 [Septoria linicola]
MASETEDRLATELELLQSIYPDQASYAKKGRELTYTSEAGSVKLRLPDGYLDDALPEVVSASSGKQDLRDQVKERVQQCETGEEVLDAIINSFIELSEAVVTNTAAQENKTTAANTRNASDTKATVIVWLHHLLNTNKRKLALHPPASVSGITKPGYPGVLIYSGPAKDVHEHVDELKSQNWQAFQPRLEAEEEWVFKHGKGVIEVEAMKDIVADIGDARKDEFMEAMRMK